MAAPFSHPVEAAQMRPQKGTISIASVVSIAMHVIPAQRFLCVESFITTSTLRHGTSVVNLGKERECDLNTFAKPPSLPGSTGKAPLPAGNCAHAF